MLKDLHGRGTFTNYPGCDLEILDWPFSFSYPAGTKLVVRMQL